MKKDIQLTHLLPIFIVGTITAALTIDHEIYSKLLSSMAIIFGLLWAKSSQTNENK